MIDLSMDIDLIWWFLVKHPIFSLIIGIVSGIIGFCFWTLYQQLSNHLPTQIKEVKQEVKEVKQEVEQEIKEVKQEIKKVKEEVKQEVKEVQTRGRSKR